jgi:citrate lyase subunit beta/citryl-CoA lyase
MDINRLNAPPMRSKLFVPATRPEFSAKALAGEADAVCFDLEDSVAASEKVQARTVLTRTLDGLQNPKRKTLLVRINAWDTGLVEEDLRVAAHPAVDIVNLPKAESAQDVERLAALIEALERVRGRTLAIVANIESPAGLRHAAEIALADTRVIGLQLGFGDLFEPLGIDRNNVIATTQVQLAVRLAAGEAGIAAYDAAYANIADAAGYRDQADAAHRLGFAGKTCIHPSQVAAANTAFMPSAEEVSQALRVIEAWRRAEAEGIGAIVVDGKMIDLPFARRAESIVALAAQA